MQAVCLEFSHVQNENAAIGGASANLAASRIPADFENATGALVTVHQLSALCAPDVHAFIETARCQEFTIWTECHRIDGFGMFGECVNACTTFDIPETNSRIK